MRIYIAYKFSNVQNKQSLREEVQNVSNILERHGHQTFILGRDLQGWKDFSHPLGQKMKKILAEMKKSDLILAYISSENFSKGLLFEMISAKILRKRVMIAIKDTINDPKMTWFASKVVKFKNFKELETLLE